MLLSYDSIGKFSYGIIPFFDRRQNNETLWIRRKLYLVGKVVAGNDSVKNNPSVETVHYCVVRSKDYRVIVN